MPSIRLTGRARARAASFATCAALASLTISPARASCGSSSCFLVTGSHEGLADPGRLQLDLSWRWLEQDRMRAGSDEASDVVTPHVDFESGAIEPLQHRELRTL